MPATSRRNAILLLLSALLAGCSSLGASGPSRSAVQKSEGKPYANAAIEIVDLDDTAARRVAEVRKSRSFSELFGTSAASRTIIGAGDLVEVSLWEAPPAILFGADAVATGPGSFGTAARTTVLPPQMVGDDGAITIPFIGPLRVSGRTTAQIERDIRGRLQGKAHDPQALVRLVQNEARNVTVLGEVAGSRRVPLTSRGERLLDILAAAGGSRQPVDKTTVQLSRGGSAAAMPLEAIILDPAQNVVVRPDDVVTVLHQPYSFIALGAVTRNAEIPFEGRGLSLAQALGRMGGLRDERADIRGVFVFRLELPEALDPALAARARRTSEGLIPVIYRLNLADAAGFFAAQDFAVRDRDVVYVSTAPAADLPKFLNTISSVAFTTIGIANLVK
jgi:polysaccharide export outer membrane protein